MNRSKYIAGEPRETINYDLFNEVVEMRSFEEFAAKGRQLYLKGYTDIKVFDKTLKDVVGLSLKVGYEFKNPTKEYKCWLGIDVAAISKSRPADYTQYFHSERGRTEFIEKVWKR